MNPYTIPVICDVCGGEGVTTIKHAASLWYGGQIVHTNPAVCAAHLRREREKLDKLKNQLTAPATDTGQK